KCTFFADLADTMTLVEQCARSLPSARTAIHVRSSVDAATMRDAPVTSFWLDEQSGSWMTPEEVERLKRRAAAVHAVSPEVWAPERRNTAAGVWKKWIKWGVDGVCTDLPVELDRLKTEGDPR